MNKLLPVLLLTLLFCSVSRAQNQTSNSLSFSAVTPPAGPTLTSLSGLSTSGKIYTGTKMPIIGTGFASACVVNIDGTAQPGSTFTFVSATEIDFTIPASLGSGSGTSHTATVSCPLPVLTMNSPVTLPNYTPGAPYSADLVAATGLTGGVKPYTFSLTSGSLPTGFSLSPSGIVAGTTSSTGSFTFSFTVADNSGLVWHYDVREGNLFAFLVPAKVTRIAFERKLIR